MQIHHIKEFFATFTEGTAIPPQYITQQLLLFIFLKQCNDLPLRTCQNVPEKRWGF